MTLWFLVPPNENGPLQSSVRVVVRAESEADARRIAAENAGPEGAKTWLSHNASWCLAIARSGPNFDAVIVSDSQFELKNDSPPGLCCKGIDAHLDGWIKLPD